MTSLDELVARAEALRSSARRSILGIAGPPGAGKSTLAQAVVRRLAASEPETVSLLPMDGYHLPNAVLEERGLRSVKGAPETFDVAAYVELLRHVRDEPDRTWAAPDFSRVTDEPVPGGISIPPEVRLVVAEGNYLLLPGPWAPIRGLCAETWFLDVDPGIERARLIRRQEQDCGRLGDAAIDWVDRSDLANAEVVRAQSAPADVRVVVAEGALGD